MNIFKNIDFIKFMIKGSLKIICSMILIIIVIIMVMIVILFLLDVFIFFIFNIMYYIMFL